LSYFRRFSGMTFPHRSCLHGSGGCSRMPRIAESVVRQASGMIAAQLGLARPNPARLRPLSPSGAVRSPMSSTSGGCGLAFSWLRHRRGVFRSGRREAGNRPSTRTASGSRPVTAPAPPKYPALPVCAPVGHSLALDEARCVHRGREARTRGSQLEQRLGAALRAWGVGRHGPVDDDPLKVGTRVRIPLGL
jgi:hypothetical protein